MEFIEQDRKMMMLLDVFDDFGQMDKNNDSMLDLEEFKIPFPQYSWFEIFPVKFLEYVQLIIAITLVVLIFIDFYYGILLNI